MRRILQPILLGLFISTVLLLAIYFTAAMGSNSAANLLLKMTLPPFNTAAYFLEPVPLDDLERGGDQIDILLLVAWAQIAMISALAVAGTRVVLMRKPA